MARPVVSIRPAGPGDRGAVLALLAASLGWVPDDHHAAFFEWKHDRNPFGPSPAWVAVDDDRGEVVGFRTFLRWEFEDGPSGEVRRAVRAVDTATHPAAQGRGLFSTLTMHAVEALTADGFDFVFNTPNDKSRPGYLKMGWEDVGRVPVLARPRSAGGLARMARARVPAELWSTPGRSPGVPAAEALADERAVAGLLASQPVAYGLQTRRSPEFLAWRYAGFPPLDYRAVAGLGGLAFLRLRRRGPALEAMLADVLVPGGDPRAAARLARLALRQSGADYAVACPGPLTPWRGGFVPLPGQGPVLTWRALARSQRPPLADWSLALGDVELF